MRRVWTILCFTFIAGTMVGVQPAAAKTVGSRVKGDPVCRKYLNIFDKWGSCSGFNTALSKSIYNSCQNSRRRSLSQCKYGWMAIQGKTVAGAADFFKHSLSVVKWRDEGQTWGFKLSHCAANVSFVGLRGIEGAVLYNVPNAANLIAKTIDSDKKLTELNCRRKETAYKALWHLGAKNKLNVMLNGFNNRRCTTTHQRYAMNVLDNWTLSKAQRAKVEKFCVALFQSPRASAYPIDACMRFLGRLKTKSSDAKEFIANYLKDHSRNVEAARALGHIGHRGAKRKLQGILRRAYSVKRGSKRIKRGRRVRYKKYKMDYWRANMGAVPAAVALVALGDRKALRAVKHWLSYDKGKKELVNAPGFEKVVLETALGAPKAQKKIKRLIKKALKKMKRAAKNDSSLKKFQLTGHLALLQMGDKTGFKYVKHMLKDGTDREISTILRHIGGATWFKYGSHYGGLGGIKIGKGALKTGDAQKLIKRILRRMRFWSNRGMKGLAVNAILDIRARIKATKL